MIGVDRLECSGNNARGRKDIWEALAFFGLRRGRLISLEGFEDWGTWAALDIPAVYLRT